MSADPLRIWVIYDHPTDVPDHYVARLWMNDKPTESIIVADDLDAIRAQLLVDKGLTKLDRNPDDDPKIVETWL